MALLRARTLTMAALAVALCFGPRQAHAQKETIKLGYIGPLTGGNNEPGLGARNAFLLAIQQANESDYPYEVVGVVEDDASDPSIGVTAAVNLVNDPDVVAAIGHWNSPVALATIHVFHGFQVPLVIWAAISPRITEFNYPEVTRVTPTLIDEIRPLADWLINERGLQTFAIVSDTTEFGRDNIDYFTQFAQQNGGEILSVDAVPVGTTDFSAILTKIRAARPDAVFFGGVVTEGGFLRKQMVEDFGLRIPMASISGLFAPRFIEIAGATAEGTVVGLGGAADNPALQAFNAAYDAAGFEEPVTPSGKFAYDATNILLKAIEENGPDSKEGLAQAIRQIEYEGVLGTTTFDANGQTEAAIQVDFLVVENGEWVDATATDATPTVTHISAASLTGSVLAADSIATAFGQALATSVEEAMTTPLPTSLGGTTITVDDGTKTARLAPLLFVSPKQVNYLVPAGTTAGMATVRVTSNGEAVSTETVQIDAIAPGLFAANGTGQGVAAALVQRVTAAGSHSFGLVFSDAPVGEAVAVPIDLGAGTDQVYLNLYGTGIRGRSSLSAVSATVSGVAVPVLYAGPQGDSIGLDQVNIGPLPASLAGRGEVQIVLTVDGKQANIVTVAIR